MVVDLLITVPPHLQRGKYGDFFLISGVKLLVLPRKNEEIQFCAQRGSVGSNYITLRVTKISQNLRMKNDGESKIEVTLEFIKFALQEDTRCLDILQLIRENYSNS